MFILVRALCALTALTSFSCAKPQGKIPEKPKLTIQLVMHAPVLTAEEKIIELAKQRYIRLIIAAKKGNPVGAATAFRFSKDIAISNSHVLKPRCITVELDRANNVEPIFQIAPADTADDLIVFKPKDQLDVPEIVLAKDVRQGEFLIGYSNAKGHNGVLRKFMVSEVDEKEGYIYLDPPTMPGDSGAGLLNSRGELAGIICDVLTGTITVDGETSGPIPMMGIAISPQVVGIYLKEVKKFIWKEIGILKN